MNVDFSVSVGSSAARPRFLKSPVDLQSLLTAGSLLPWIHFFTYDPLRCCSNTESNLPSLIFTPTKKKRNSRKTLVCADDFTEGLQCQREFASCFAILVNMKGLVLPWPWATVTTWHLSLATFFSDCPLLPLPSPTCLYSLLPPPSSLLNSPPPPNAYNW